MPLPSRTSAPPARRRPAARALGLLALLALATSCVGTRADVHLAPVYSRWTGADDVTEHEGLGGFVRARRDPTTGDLQSVELRPLFGWRRGWADPVRAPEPYRDWQPSRRTDVRFDYLAPLGFHRRNGDRISNLLAPLWFYNSAPIEGSDARERNLFAVPGIIFSTDETGVRQAGLFPIYGDLDGFITYEHVRFVLFPLYTSARRADFTHHNVLFPILGWTWNHPEPGSRSPRRKNFRLWPLFGWNEKPGHWKKSFFLWPFFTRTAEGLWRDEPDQLRSWMLWPLFGWTRRSTYRSAVFLWPLFGLAWDPRGGELDPSREPGEGPDRSDTPRDQLLTEPANPGGTYWAWDGPWPFVRIQRGGRAPAAEERTRAWPFYSHFRGDGLWWRTWAWPVVQQRREIAPDYERASFYVIPFYQSTRLERSRPDGPADLPDAYLRGERERWNKLWPLIQSEEIDDWRRDQLFALTPTTRWNLFDHYWSWLWEIWALERNGERRSGRSWLGLYLYETDGDERRHSVSGLWSRRSWGQGETQVRETSLLFGLLRWRSGPGTDDAGLMAPAFPGPGWPAEWTRQDATQVAPGGGIVAPRDLPRGRATDADEVRP